MSNKKISEFPGLDAIDVTNDDVMPIVNDATNKKFSWANIKAALASIFLQKSSNLSDVADTATARNNILPSKTGNALKVLRVNSGETDYELAAISSGITIGTTSISSGTTGRLIFQGSGNVVQQDSLLHWDNTDKRLGLGINSSLLGRLHCKGPGDLSSDIAGIFTDSSGNIISRLKGDRVSEFYQIDGIQTNGLKIGTNIGVNTAPISDAQLFFADLNLTYGIYFNNLSSYTSNYAAYAVNYPYRHSFYSAHIGIDAAFQAQNTGVGFSSNKIGFKASDFGNNSADNIGFSANMIDGANNIAFDIVNGDIRFSTGTGTKMGTGSSEKLSFWGATPIAQPTTGIGPATLSGGGGTTLTDTDTFDGYTLKQVVKALRNAGLLA